MEKNRIRLHDQAVYGRCTQKWTERSWGQRASFGDAGHYLSVSHIARRSVPQGVVAYVPLRTSFDR